jgi:DNA-binding NarL/FixJ family response regulator
LLQPKVAVATHCCPVAHARIHVGCLISAPAYGTIIGNHFHSEPSQVAFASSRQRDTASGRSIGSKAVMSNAANPHSNQRCRVMLADDHAILREGLRMLISAQNDLEVVGEARGGHEAVQMATELAPDVVVLDVSMPDLDGAEVAAQIGARCPQARVLALTRHADPGYLRRMLQAGAQGYVLKQTAGDVLLEAIRTLARGGSHIDPTLAGALMTRNFSRESARGEPARPPSLSEREEQVLRLVAWGKSNKEVALQLGISVKTAEFYKASAVAKLGLRSRTDILRHALAEKWLDAESAPE